MSFTSSQLAAGGVAAFALFSGRHLALQGSGRSNVGFPGAVDIDDADMSFTELAVLVSLLVVAVLVLLVKFSGSGPESSHHTEPAPLSKPPASSSGDLTQNELKVKILHATGLSTHNALTHDQFYVHVRKVNGWGPHQTDAKFDTKRVSGKKTECAWDETHKLSPWCPGNHLEIGLYNHGLIGYKSEGTFILASSLFCPNGFEGEIELTGGRHGGNVKLRVQVECPEVFHLPVHVVDAGWEVAVDQASGHIYYYNHGTRVSQWNMPK